MIVRKSSQLCSRIAASIALSMLAALPIASAADIPVPEQEGMPPIQRCVVESLRVDGLPVVQHGYCYWDTEQRMWVPLSADLARRRVFGIRPIPE
jgi:hypothetical protein